MGLWQEELRRQEQQLILRDTTQERMPRLMLHEACADLFLKKRNA